MRNNVFWLTLAFALACCQKPTVEIAHPSPPKVTVIDKPALAPIKLEISAPAPRPEPEPPLPGELDRSLAAAQELLRTVRDK